jgi:hypothetical protein
MIIARELVPGGLEYAGILPAFFSHADPSPAREQIDANYRHGGGWHAIDRFKHLGDYKIQYPGDPPLKPLVTIRLRDEVVMIYAYSMVGIFQPDGSFEVARID